MLNLKANKKLLQDKLSQTTGKVVLLKDLSNLSTRMKAGEPRNDLQECAKRLTEKYGKLYGVCECIVLKYGFIATINCLHKNPRCLC